jgi:hypothetical protein
VVCKSTDGGQTYTQSAVAWSARRVDDLVGNDKFMLATGRDPVVADRQNVYIAWTWNIPTINNLDQQLAVSGSTDGGATFSAPVVINDNSLFGRDRALFADPSVGPDGELYVSWHDFDNSARIMVDRSFDGGVTWGTDVLVSNFALGLKTPIPPQPDRGVAAGPVMDVDVSNGPHRGRAYLAYCHPGAYGFDILLRYSDDQAASWSEPVRVSDDVTMHHQFLPWLDVGPRNGIVSVVFYDAREDPNNQLARVHYAISRDGGESFEPNQPLADVPSNMSTTNPNRYIGNYLEYIGVATLDCAAYVVWADTRHNWPVFSGWADYYFDRIPFETEPPHIACPPPLEMECERGGILFSDPRIATWAGSCTALDDCAPACAVKWTAPSNGFNPPRFFKGSTTVTFTAYDNAGNTASCQVPLTVVDTRPPALAVSVNPEMLWPPDHGLVDVVASVQVNDECDPLQQWVLWSVSSNEPENGTGDGDAAPDIIGAQVLAQDRRFQLRAERSGTGIGRRYQIVYQVTDGIHEVFDTVYVDVPHDRDAEPGIDDNATSAVRTTMLQDVRPNPFNPETTVLYELARAETVRLSILDVRGALVRTLLEEPRPAGSHRARWDGRDDRGGSVASGVYFVRMSAGSYTSVRKIVLLK